MVKAACKRMVTLISINLGKVVLAFYSTKLTFFIAYAKASKSFKNTCPHDTNFCFINFNSLLNYSLQALLLLSLKKFPCF